jgi:hypothetical protein
MDSDLVLPRYINVQFTVRSKFIGNVFGEATIVSAPGNFRINDPVVSIFFSFYIFE